MFFLLVPVQGPLDQTLKICRIFTTNAKKPQMQCYSQIDCSLPLQYWSLWFILECNNPAITSQMPREVCAPTIHPANCRNPR